MSQNAAPLTPVSRTPFPSIQQGDRRPAWNKGSSSCITDLRKTKIIKGIFFKIALLRTIAEKAQWCSLSQSICLIISLIPVHLWPKRVTWSRLSPYFISSIVLCVFFKSVIFKRKFGISLIDDVVSFMFGIIEGINVCLFNLFFFKKVNGFRNCWRDSKMTQLTDFYLFIVKNLASLKFS